MEKERTKKGIAASLKELCQTKALDKISIVDITKTCGINRQTFYYHFTDKYELLSWVYTHEAFPHLTNGITLENWGQCLAGFLSFLEAEQSFYTNAIRHEPDCFKDYLFDLTKTLFAEVIAQIDTAAVTSQPERDFYATFFAYGCTGVICAWVAESMPEPAKILAQRIYKMAKDTERAGSFLYNHSE